MYITIGEKQIGENQKPFIIAEMSANHNQSLERAYKLIDIAVEAKVDAIKLQTYTPESMTLNSFKKEFVINNKESLWNGKRLYDLYREAYLPLEWNKKLFDYAKKRNMIIFSSPFDEEAVDLLEELNAPAYKIASYELTHIPLIKKVAKTGKPIILSTGMATEEEIIEAIEACEEEGNHQIILLKCTSIYPTPIEYTNLKSIKSLKNNFGKLIGISDHTKGITIPIAASALGVVVIEKHFTDDKKSGGPDAEFSLDGEELKSLVINVEQTWRALGDGKIGYSEIEENPRQRRRSIYVSKDVKKGDTITEENVKIVRPASGMHPRYFYEIIGKKFNEDISMGEPLEWSNIK